MFCALIQKLTFLNQYVLCIIQNQKQIFVSKYIYKNNQQKMVNLSQLKKILKFYQLNCLQRGPMAISESRMNTF